MKFDPPNASVGHQELIKLAQSAKLDLPLRRLMWLINAHPDLVGHGRVFENVLAHLQTDTFHASSLDWARDWTKDIPEWIRLCNWLITHRQRIALLAGLTGFHRHEDGKHPVVGEGVDRHGVVAALWSRHETSPQYPPKRDRATPGALTYFGLQGHLLAAYVECRYRLSKLDFYESYDLENERPIAPTRTGVVGLALRELSHDRYSPLLAQIELHPSTLKFAEAITGKSLALSEIDSELAEDGERYFSAVRRFFQRFLQVLDGWEPQQTLKRGWGGGGGHARRHGFVHVKGPDGVYLQEPEPPPTDPDIPQLVGQKVSIDLDQYFKKAPIALKEPDLSPSETLEKSGLAPSETLEEAFHLYTPEEHKGRVYAARYQRLAAEASAQALPFDYSQLTPQELQEVNALAQQMITQYVEDTSADLEAKSDAIGGLIVRTMLCLGQTPQTARSLESQWITDETCDRPVEPVNDHVTLIIRAPSKGDWDHARVEGFCLPAITPDYRTILPERLDEIDRDSVESFILPDHFGLGREVLDFMRRESTPDLSAFGVNQKSATDAVTKLTQRFPGQRITPEKIARALANIIFSLTGDQVLAWVVSADWRNANQARMHYTRYPVDAVQLTYTKASRRLAKLMQVRLHPPQASRPLQLSTATVGARFVIKKSEVKDLVARLRSHLTERYQARLTDSDIRRYHSHYLLYTAIYQGLLTSFRVVDQPYALYEACSQSSRHAGEVHASLCDKDSRYTDRARLVPILPALAEHFDHYALHRQWLIKRLPISEPWILAMGKKHPFFTIEQDFRVVPLGASWMKQALKEFSTYEIPANFHRAFLRTELLARGCSPQIIDAHLGHANFGELPHSRMSTFDYHQHFVHLRKELQGLHDDLGLQPIGSRLVPHKTRIGGA